MLGLERDQLDGGPRLGLGPGLGLRDQSFAKSARLRFGTIAAAFDGQIRALPIARAFAVSIAIAVSRPLVESFDAGRFLRWRAERAIAVSIAIAVSRPLVEFFDAGRFLRWRAERRVNRARRRPAAGVAASISVAFSARVTAALTLARGGRLGQLGAGPTAFEVLGFDVRDVQKPVAADREVDERGLDRWLEVDDSSLVDVPGVALVARSLDVKLFEYAVLDNGDPAFLGLFDVDQHFFLHAVSFRNFRRLSGVVCGVIVSG
jgi:hypothetical protein